MKKIRVIISGGGTAGHIFPALSIADELSLQKNKYEILFIGAKNRMEMKKVATAGYDIKGLWIDGFQRNISLRNLIFPIKLFFSLFHSLFILIKFNPSYVVGTGGFVSGPVVFIAAILGIPTLIHEQNSFPGITNRILGKVVNNVCVSYKNMTQFFPKNKVIKTGNPVRKLLKINTNKNNALDYFGFKKNKITILIVGGSLGAEPINNFVKKELIFFSKYQVIWQTGKKNYDLFLNSCVNHKSIIVYDFIEKMNFAYSAADLVISRAGAIAISEICFLQKCSILIPSPHVTENHQYKNAMSLEENGACSIVEEKNIEKELVFKIKNLVSNKKNRIKISEKAKGLCINNSSYKIVQIINRNIK
tara:strand:+ start:8698 stop:9783 length:1086 start_codon:yes stop_codon:yes gene_type:complete